MVSSVHGLFPVDTTVDYEDEEWQIFLRDHIAEGLLANIAIPMEVKPQDAKRFEYDLFGWLRSQGFSQNLDQIHLMVNHMEHPMEFGLKHQVLLTIQEGRLRELWLRFAQNRFKFEDE